MQDYIKDNYKNKTEEDVHLFSVMENIACSKAMYNETDSQADIFQLKREKANLYMLCFRAHVRFAKGVYYDDVTGSVRGILEVQQQDGLKNIPFEIEEKQLAILLAEQLVSNNIESATVVRLDVSDFPHTMLNVYVDALGEDGTTRKYFLQFELEVVAKHFRWHIPEVHDLEVWYIGQSVGKKEMRNARERLKSSEHRMRANNIMQNGRCLDLIAVYLDFSALVLRGLETENVDMPAKNVINLIEGGLIYHFKPEGNTKEKKIFPNDQPVRENVQMNKITGQNITFSFDGAGFRIFSSTRAACHDFCVDQVFDEEGYGKDVSHIEESVLDPEIGITQRLFAMGNRQYIKQVESEIYAHMSGKEPEKEIADVFDYRVYHVLLRSRDLNLKPKNEVRKNDFFSPLTEFKMFRMIGNMFGVREKKIPEPSELLSSFLIADIQRSTDTILDSILKNLVLFGSRNPNNSELEAGRSALKTLAYDVGETFPFGRNIINTAVRRYVKRNKILISTAQSGCLPTLVVEALKSDELPNKVVNDVQAFFGKESSDKLKDCFMIIGKTLHSIDSSLKAPAAVPPCDASIIPEESLLLNEPDYSPQDRLDNHYSDVRGFRM